MWNFNMFISDSDLLINSKIKIDLVYNNEAAICTCILVKQNKLSCYYDTQNQKRDNTFSISSKKVGSVTYLNDLRN